MQALYLQKKNKHKIAIAILNEVIQKDPSYDKAYNAMGISYDYLGDYSNAIKSYKLALKINPDLDYVHNNLGYSHLLNGNLDSAIDAFQKAIVLNENNKRYHNNLGLAYAQKGQFDLAIEQFTLAGDEISANQKLSQIFYRKGKHELARKYRNKAVQLEAAINNERSIEEEKKSVPKNIPQDNIPQNESLKRTSEKQKPPK
jgi:Flp pilus assembly protein TadD